MRIKAFIAMVFGLVLALPCTASGPSEFSRAGIEPIITPDAFRALAIDLGLTPSEVDVSAMLFRDYSTAMNGVLAGLEAQRAEDRSRLDAALAGRIRLSPEELRALRIRIRTAVEQAWAEADRWQADLVQSVLLLSTLPDDPMRRALETFDREIHCGTGNRLALVDLADLAPPDLAGASAGVETLATYRSAIASVAASHAQLARSTRLEDDLAAIRGEKDVRRTLQRESSGRWMTRMEIHDRFVDAVAAILASSGQPEAPWRRAADAALFPRIYSEPDAQYAADWVIANGSQSQSATARQCIEDGMSRLEPLRRQAVALLREGRTHGADLSHDAAGLVDEAGDVRMRFLRNTGERSVLIQGMTDCVMGELTDGQRAAVRRVLLERRQVRTSGR